MNPIWITSGAVAALVLIVGVVYFRRRRARRSQAPAPDGAAATRPVLGRVAWWAVPLLAFTIPAGAVMLYLQLNPPTPGFRADWASPHLGLDVHGDGGGLMGATTPSAPAAAGGGKIDSVADMAARLAQRLQSHPDDAAGWTLLGRSYEYLKRYGDAARAYGRALQAGAAGAGLRDRMARMQRLAGSAAHAPAPAKTAPNLDATAAALKQRLAGHPDDAGAWTRLAHIYQRIGRYADASAAYARLTELKPADARAWADYADTLAAAGDKRLPGRPEKLIAKALALDPNEPKALWLAGTAAMEQHRPKQALQYWQRLRGVLPPGSHDARVLDSNIREARSAAGEPAAPAAAAVTGTVRIDPKLAATVSPDDTVFIYARAVKGPPMPLAVLRKRVKDLPLQFRLTDAMAMLPSMKLSQFSRVRVTARVSRTGNAVAQPGDLTSASRQVQVGSGKGIQLTISKPVS
ncbi:MAG: hypothetical protein P8090_17415 [Gammaproteobacteria bacterium]